MKYNLSILMKKAWNLYKSAAKKIGITFSEALRRAWAWIKVQAANAEKVETVATAWESTRSITHGLVGRTTAGW